MVTHEIIGLLAGAIGLAVLLKALTDPVTGSTVTQGIGAFSGLVNAVTGRQGSAAGGAVTV